MRILAGTVIVIVLAGCQAATVYERDVAGRTAPGSPPPLLPEAQRFRMADWEWNLGVRTCISAAHRTGRRLDQSDVADIVRYCACNFDLIQTRMSLQQFERVSLPERNGLPVSPDDIRVRQKIADACSSPRP